MTTPSIVAVTGVTAVVLRGEDVRDEGVLAAVELVAGVSQPEAGARRDVAADDQPNEGACADIASYDSGHVRPGRRGVAWLSRSSHFVNVTSAPWRG